MIKFNTVKNNQGFTAVEVTVGIGLVAILTVVMVTTQLMVTKDQSDLVKQLDSSIDETLAERILFNDFATIDPSYNNLKLPDDSGLSFFDYYPDVPANLLTGSLSRAITLSSSSAIKTFSVLVQDTKQGAVMLYDPTAAYQIGPTPTNFNQAATLTFQGLNFNKWVSGARDKFWQDGRTLMLDTPAKLRPVVNNLVDMKVPPRSPIFIGIVNREALPSLRTDLRFASLFNYTQPDTGALIDSADTFLRNAPSIGGGQSLIRLRAVKIIQYSIDTPKDGPDECKVAGTNNWYKSSRLYKTVFENGNFSTPFMLADKVCSFELTRDSVLKRMIYFKINKISQEDLRNKKTASQTAGL